MRGVNINEKLPPQSTEAEESVLGSMLIDEEAVSSVIEVLKPRDFYKEVHRKIYESILNLQEENQPVDLVTL